MRTRLVRITIARRKDILREIVLSQRKKRFKLISSRNSFKHYKKRCRYNFFTIISRNRKTNRARENYNRRELTKQT